MNIQYSTLNILTFQLPGSNVRSMQSSTLNKLLKKLHFKNICLSFEVCWKVQIFTIVFLSLISPREFVSAIFQMGSRISMQRLTNSIVLDLCKRSGWIYVGAVITVEQLHQVYTVRVNSFLQICCFQQFVSTKICNFQNILDDSKKIYGICVRWLKEIHAFLSLIGITLKDGEVFLSKDAEVNRHKKIKRLKPSNTLFFERL